jgi:hypothetical protein
MRSASIWRARSLYSVEVLNYQLDFLNLRTVTRLHAVIAGPARRELERGHWLACCSVYVDYRPIRAYLVHLAVYHLLVPVGKALVARETLAQHNVRDRSFPRYPDCDFVPVFVDDLVFDDLAHRQNYLIRVPNLEEVPQAHCQNYLFMRWGVPNY